MEFMVTRTSEWRNSVKSCKEAFLKSYTRIDCRTYKSFEEFQLSQKIDFKSEGSNHRKIKGIIARDFPAKGWFIKIDTLDDLLTFKSKYGDLVLKNSFDNEDILELEIYDSYRE